MTDNVPVMSMLNTQMRYLTQRQTVLAQNVANIDTPGYKSKDLKKLDFSDLASSSGQRLAMTTTSPKHLESPGAGKDSTFTVNEVKTSEISPMGNTVNVEDEMHKVSDTNTQFQEATNLMKKYTQMLHEAASSH